MSFSQTWNLAKTFAAFPCAEPNPVIVATTLIPAVAPALLEWVSFGCRDMLKFRLGIGAPCGRALKAQVAKVIPPTFVDVVNNVLKWEHRFSYAGQMFLLADLASDTLARWTTLAYQMSGCPDALDGAYWGYRGAAPGALSPGVPTVVGGLIVDEVGTPGVAWPTGAIAPPDWWVSIHFQLEAVALFSHVPIGLQTWVSVNDGSTYDFPANKYPPGYPGQVTKASYTLTTQNHNPRRHVEYTMYAMSDQLALAYNLTGHGQCTPFPPYKEFLSPLGCLRNLAVTSQENPAGRNPQSRSPTIVDKWIGAAAPKPVRGPPGGKPRGRR